MINFLGYDIFGLIKSGIGTAISAGIRTIFFEICGFVYELIIGIYDVFLALCKAQILDIDIISGIAQRVGLILGLVMFFMVSFSFIQMVLDPDKITDKEKGAVNIVKKVLIVIVMFGMSSFVFDKLQDIQSIVIENGILNRILLPGGYNVNSDDFGKVLSTNLFMSFYSPKELAEDDATASDDYKENYDYCVIDYANFEDVAIEYGNFSSNCVTTAFKFTDEEKATDRFTFVMNFNYILCLLVGVFVCYFFIMYTISIGMRVIQLTFLQMISPMAFIAYLSPKKDNMFSKWLKTYVMTYLDVFIRIAIISLGSFLISILMDSWTDITAVGDSFGSVFWHSVSNGGTIRHPLYIKIIMIMAILSFMKKAPELIKQIIPSTGAAGTLSYGFSAKDRAGFTYGKAVAAGAVGGIASGAMSSFTHYRTNRAAGLGRKESIGLGAIGGIVGASRGAFDNIKGGGTFKNLSSSLGKTRQANNKYNEMRLTGGTTLGKYRALIGDTFGESAGQRDARLISNYETVGATKEKLKKIARNTDSYQEAERAAEAYKHSSNATTEGIKQWNETLKMIEKDIITHGMNGNDWENISSNDRNAVTEMRGITVDFKGTLKTRGINLGEINDSSQLSDAVDAANEKINEIKSKPEYQKNKINDIYAGNNSNKTSDKK